ncbi:MAG: hypothetical protein K1000chlam3_01024 [Chlamydiae bacterium]|nr:hypothetical protein [Chlamydiota bacterium]
MKQNKFKNYLYDLGYFIKEKTKYDKKKKSISLNKKDSIYKEGE